MKKKLYFAKSNRANPDHVMRVREVLSDFDLEIVEFKGGSYSHEPMLGCDYLLVLPDLSEVYEQGVTYSLGKGLYNQIWSFSSCCERSLDVMVIHDINEFHISVSEVDELEEDDESNYIHYGYVHLETTTETSLRTYLEEEFGMECGESHFNKIPSISSPSLTNRHLLITSK